MHFSAAGGAASGAARGIAAGKETARSNFETHGQFQRRGSGAFALHGQQQMGGGFGVRCSVMVMEAMADEITQGIKLVIFQLRPESGGGFAAA